MPLGSPNNWPTSWAETGCRKVLGKITNNLDYTHCFIQWSRRFSMICEHAWTHGAKRVAWIPSRTSMRWPGSISWCLLRWFFSLQIVFQLTVRMATCRELATDVKAMDRVQHLFWILEKNSTPTALLLPWLPSPAKRRKDKATLELYSTLLHYVDVRKKANVPSYDAIDMLLSQGLGDQEIVGVW